MIHLNLCLHTGARKIERDQLATVSTPAPTSTWVPIPHDQLLAGVVKSLAVNDLTVVSESHAITPNGARYFGLLQIVNLVRGRNADDFSLVVGVRNSHDRTFPAGLVVGASVFVCDNLSFSGEIKLARKHTLHINRDLPQLICRAIGAVQDHRGKQEQRFITYKGTEFTDAQAHDLVIRAVDARVCPPMAIPHIIRDWREPRHREFRNGKTGWRLFNAFTECLKGNLDFLPRRTKALHGLMDMACQVEAQKPLPFVPKVADDEQKEDIQRWQALNQSLRDDRARVVLELDEAQASLSEREAEIADLPEQNAEHVARVADLESVATIDSRRLNDVRKTADQFRAAAAPVNHPSVAPIARQLLKAMAKSPGDSRRGRI